MPPKRVKSKPTEIKTWPTSRPVELFYIPDQNIDQKTHAARLMNILTKNHGFMDTSEMGLGKTIVTCYIAQQYNFPLLVFCPVGAIPVWEDAIEYYGIPYYGIFSYEETRSRKGSQPRNGLVTRLDYTTEAGKNKVKFSVTQEAMNIFANGVLLVADEIQKIKNHDTAQYKAVAVLLRQLLCTGQKSRYALLSGSPFDKKEHALSLLKAIGYISHDKLYVEDRETGRMKLVGMQELIDVSKGMDEKTTETILRRYPAIEKRNLTDIIFDLFIHVIRPAIRSSMPPRRMITDTANGFYDLNNEDQKALEEGINQLAKAVNYNPSTGELLENKRNLGDVTLSLQKIEKAKIPIFTRLGYTVLKNMDKHKVIFEVNFTDTVKALQQAFAEYHPLILTGEVDRRDRREVVEAFQNDSKARVIICNIEVGSVSISLHDRRGEEDRWMFISPTYKLLSIFQAASRHNRIGVKSLPHTRIVYGKKIMELNIIDAIARKSGIVKQIIEEEGEEVGARVPLPGDYRRFVEGETKGASYSI